MKAIVYTKFGNTDVLENIEVPKPSIQPTQVLIKVKAVSINPLDWKIRKGEMKMMSGSKFPKGLGIDFSGHIEELGSDVKGFKKGDEVFGLVNAMKEGALAEYIVVGGDKIWKKPEEINHRQAASLPIVGSAAILAIEKMGKINSDTEILINGASGGLGMILLQLLKQRGAKIAAVANTEGIEYVKKWGADVAIDYTQQNVLNLGKRYDIVVDLSGRMGYKNAKSIMKDKSVFINPTPTLAPIVTTPIFNILRGKKHLVLLSSPSTKAISALQEGLRKGLKIEVSKTFPFDQVKEAYQYAEKGGYIGKLVIEF